MWATAHLLLSRLAPRAYPCTRPISKSSKSTVASSWLPSFG